MSTGPEISRAGPYDEIVEHFRWDIPATFNFGADVVDRWAHEADGLALICENEAGDVREYRYSEISALTDRLASSLSALGLGKGDRIIVMLPRVAEWPIAMVAALKAGLVPIPCIEMLAAGDVTYRVRTSGARAAICMASQAPKFAAVEADLAVRIAVGRADGWRDYRDMMAASPARLEPITMAATDPAVLYYTSGSSGPPKGVLHATHALYAWRYSAQYWLNIRHGDRIWCTADTGWSKAGTSILFGPWSTGACSYLYDGPFEPRRRLELLAKQRINVYCAPATELARLILEDPSSFDLRSLRRTVSAGEAVSPAIADAWQALTGLRIDEAYGLTEALMLVLNYPGEAVKYGSMGRPSPGARIELLDDAGQILGDGVEGEMALLAPHPQLMLGYWHDPSRTEARFRSTADGRWFMTGDRAVRDADGYLWYRGRSDDIINSSGYRIGPSEVEDALLSHASVQECAVVGIPDAERGELVKAFVVLKDANRASEELIGELQHHVKMVAAPYKYPRRIAFVTDLPRTATGKISRRALREGPL